MPVISPRLRLHPLRRGARAFAPPEATVDRLSDLAIARGNPGNLRTRFYVPDGLEGPAPLVVVLHGCTQSAAVYDHGSGWSQLADRHGFILLFPEQQRPNNPMLCFNWFSDGDTRRGRGEAVSIREMIDAMGGAHEIDATRVFVTGLSAGGAMASALLATYPEIFAGGAILAGVAYGCASGVGEAFDCMGGRREGSASELGDKVRRASRHRGPWPRIQVWQGSADNTVVPSNAEAIVRQWTDVHGLGSQPDRLDQVKGFPRRAWLDGTGRPVIEHYTVTGMAHGVPLASGNHDSLGVAGTHMLDVGLSSTARIAAFFGIAPEAAPEGSSRAAGPAAVATDTPPEQQPAQAPRSTRGVEQIIEKALKAAGLIR